MKNKKRVLFTIGITLFALFFVLPAVVFSIINWGILPSRKLTPIVVNEVNKRINGQFECEEVELTFFNTYPHLGLSLSGGQLDSLLRFKEVVLTIRPMDYLFKGILTIGDVRIEDPVFYGLVDSEGRANWDVLIASEEEQEEDADTMQLPPIDLQKVEITGGSFTYDDRQADIYTEVEGFFLTLTGSLINGGNTLSVETGSSSILFESPDYSLNNNMALHFESDIELTDNYHTVTLKNSAMRLNNLPFSADGSFSYLPEMNILAMNVEMGLQASDLNELIGFIPEAYLKNRADILATGSIRMDANIFGELGDHVMPTINATCTLENGSYHMKGVDQGIDALEMEMDILLSGAEPEASHVTLDKLNLTGMNTSLQMNGKVTDILQSPAVDATIKGKVDLTRMAGELMDADTLLIEGFMDADIQASFTVDDLLEGRYNKIQALGYFNIDSLKAFSEPYEMDVFVRGVHFTMDTVKSTSRYIKGDNLLSGALTVDRMRVKYKEDINTMLRGMEITAKTSPVIDTTEVMSVTSHIRVEQIRSRLPDSVTIVAKNAYLRGGTKPSDSNKKIPQLMAAITVDSLRYFDIPSQMGISFAASTFSVEALPLRDAMRQRMQTARQDSTRQMSARTSSGRQREARANRRQQPTDSVPANATTASSSTDLLRNWEVRGSVLFDQMRLFSRAFPLPMRMEKTKVKFDTNTVQFTDALFYAGNSNFTLTGEINSIRRAMLRGGKLQGKFSVGSDYMDCNQLIGAISRGMQEMEQQDQREQDVLLADDNLASLEILQDSVATQPADSADRLFVVPAFLDMSLVMNAKKIDYKDLEMEHVEGEIVMRNQSINLKKLDMRSNIGEGNFSMYYTAKNTEKASVGCDLEMRAIQVEKLIDLYPAIDTLLPMLRSFEGIVDCTMAVTCDIDSTSSVILPSLHTGCSVAGKNMVLLDGETFAEISKTLMFKNKEKNVIDNISVDLVVKENKIQIFPFLLEMDRYRVAVGGTHNLDMTFNYHVSVLKSPVPFKLGVDVTGNLDDFKYKIVKCRYKDIFQAATQKELDPTPHNLRAEIKEYIRQQIVENAPELALLPPQRPRETAEEKED
ncbi:AsmA-like C-terminal region-containing protein [Parabacteroides sp. PF5-6]|uniref:AsmA family protein n=1 Tax=Parabacteroides sp. PF5-6 TaxID=1742403 RepID=UPI002405FD03|nr:AsmA-like C-terminal region-containing protein [Parabacteroides sp. PF5-6]MDF9829749.1 hypothetical protein [Parabacteroides sp. PF5-6]